MYTILYIEILKSLIIWYSRPFYYILFVRCFQIMNIPDLISEQISVPTPVSGVNDGHAVITCQSNWTPLSYVWLTSGSSLNLVQVDFGDYNLKLGEIHVVVRCSTVKINILDKVSAVQVHFHLCHACQPN